MSVETVYRLLCDAPYCTATAMVERASDAPDGWSVLRSTDHLAGKPKPMVGRGRNRRPVDGWEIGNGSFRVHLCPDHPEAFGEHWPQTTGFPKGRAIPGCACGWRCGSMEDVRLVGRRPSSTVERAWRRHLPEQLRWYATREPAGEVKAS